MRFRPRHISRYRQIAEVLVDYGFGAFLAQIGLSDRLNIPRRLLRRKPILAEDISMPRRFRLALEELGPTFIKIGQILSTRSDLLPPEWLDELRSLQDDVAPLDWEIIQGVISEELGAPVKDIFNTIDPLPLASASIAQVHSAILANSGEVVVKVQRPGIESTINLDLDILYDLAHLANERTSIGERYEVAELAEEFANSLRAELDFHREGRNAERFQQNFAKERFLYVPKVYWDYSTSKVIVLERIRGIKIDDIHAIEAAGYDRSHLANHAARFILREVLEDGFFHADPHPGNLMVLPGEVIGVVDFGTMGRLDSSDRMNLARLFIVLVQMDAEGIVEQLLRMGIADYQVDRMSLQRDLRRLLMRYHGLPISEISAQEVLEGLEPIIYEYRLHVPSDYWLLIKTIVVMQGVGLGLDPDFDIFEASQPYLQHLFLRLWHPSTLGPTALRVGTDWGEFVSAFPRQTTRILDQLERGNFETRILFPELEETVNRVDRIANRIIYGVLVAAMTVALALLIPGLDLEWPWGLLTWLVLLGFLTMSFLGLQLIWSILRSGHRRR
jgi:ubiquinone biosynthesis protein